MPYPSRQLLSVCARHPHRNSTSLQWPQKFSLNRSIGSEWLRSTSHRLSDLFLYDIDCITHTWTRRLPQIRPRPLWKATSRLVSCRPGPPFSEMTLDYIEQTKTRRSCQLSPTYIQEPLRYFIPTDIRGPLTFTLARITQKYYKSLKYILYDESCFDIHSF